MLGTRAMAWPAAGLAGNKTTARPKRQDTPATENFALDKLRGVIRDSVAHRAQPAKIHNLPIPAKTSQNQPIPPKLCHPELGVRALCERRVEGPAGAFAVAVAVVRPHPHNRRTVISTEAAHAFVSSAVEKSASPPLPFADHTTHL